MGLFSFLRKNKQEESASGQAGYQSRPGDDAAASRTRAKRKAARETDDTEIPEKKRARRRLIGAIVLVMIVVVVLPMVFDPEPNPEIDNIVIQIPSRDQPSVAPVPVTAVEPDSQDTSATEDLEEVIAPSAVEPARPASVVAEKPATAVAPAVVAAPKPAPAVTPTPKPAPVVTAPVARPAPTPAPAAPAAVPPSRQDDAARALAILEGRAAKPAPAPAPAATGGKFVVQVAALASQDKVAELRKKLSDAGIQSFTQKIATKDGERTRIRVGPFNGKDDAEKMRARINKLGLSASLVPA